jgi:hypothetical protein
MSVHVCGYAVGNMDQAGKRQKIYILFILDYLASFCDYFMLMRVWIIDGRTSITRA